VAKHKNKHIREAIEYALVRGWRFTKSAGHNFGILWCPARTREGCRRPVYSTPRVPEKHAKDIRRAVDRCPHGDPKENGENDE